MKITHHKVIGDGWISQRISLMNTCWVAVSQSMIYQNLNMYLNFDISLTDWLPPVHKCFSVPTLFKWNIISPWKIFF